MRESPPVERMPVLAGAPDAELLAHVAARGALARAALAELYERYAPRVYGLARRALPADQAEDVVQDVFLRVWQAAATFDGARGTAAAWLYALTRNCCRDAYRRLRRLPLPRADLAPPPQPDVEDAALAHAEVDLLHRQLAALAPPLRQLVELVYFRSHTLREAAAVLGVPLGTVKRRLHQALVALRAAGRREGG